MKGGVSHPKKFTFSDDSENVYFIYNLGGTVFGRPAGRVYLILLDETNYLYMLSVICNNLNIYTVIPRYSEPL